MKRLILNFAWCFDGAFPFNEGGEGYTAMVSIKRPTLHLKR